MKLMPASSAAWMIVDRLVVVGVAPRAEHHGAEAQRADLHARPSERAVLSRLPPRRRGPSGGRYRTREDRVDGRTSGELPDLVGRRTGRRCCLANASGTGYSPSRKFRIAACCISTGWIVAAVLIRPGFDFTPSIAARYVAAATFSRSSASMASPGDVGDLGERLVDATS